MKVIFHEDYNIVYTHDPAAGDGRMKAIYRELTDLQILEPQPAQDKDILLVHTEEHLNDIKNETIVYSAAMLAAGGAIKASEFALKGEPAFALIRPPGHHASPNSCWGFCYFNNIAIAIEKLIKEKKIVQAAIVDFDLHFGDGTDNFFRNRKDVIYHHGEGRTNESFIENISEFLQSLAKIDMIGVSAGFDRHIADWGGLLTTKDYETIGKILKDYTEANCNGRRFAVLEGGYNHNVLGKNVRAFIEGFQ